MGLEREDGNLNRIIHMHLMGGERRVFSWPADRCNEFSSCVAVSVRGIDRGFSRDQTERARA